jgi:signal transduction histidine kinase
MPHAQADLVSIAVHRRAASRAVYRARRCADTRPKQVWWGVIPHNVASCYHFLVARGAISVVSKSDQQLFLLATLPPSKRQIGLALGIVVAIIAAFGATAPFANTPLARVDGFIPALETAIVIADLTTSALLFAQFSIVRQLGLLVLASGYLFSGLIVISHALSFPGAFTPTGVIGDGLQSTAWLYYFWKVSLPVTVIVYVLLKDTDRGATMLQRSPAVVIGLSVAAVIALACALTWIAIAGEWLLPKVHLDSIEVATVTRHLVGGLVVSLIAAALALLWLRRSSVLDLWLMVMCCALLLEIAMAIMLVTTRYSLGFYASRLSALLATILVLLVLLSETTILHANLARSMIRQRSEREARQAAMDVMAASIAHEINQPLAAIVANGAAGLRWLERSAPDFDEVRAALNRIVDDGHRANKVITSVRSMFKKDIHGRALLGINDVVREVLKTIELDLRIKGVSVATELREGLPRLLADRGQLRQVLLNLIMNAIEAMASVTDRARLLRIKSDVIQGRPDVLLTIEDSGTGIDSKDKDRIFEPFFTTKSTGTGMGLTICQSIIESHGGSLRVSANKPHGTIFQVALSSDAL